MKFGPVALDAALGARLAHTVRLAGRTLKKGAVLGHDSIDALRAEGMEHVTAALLEDGEIDENEAATRIASATASDSKHRLPRPVVPISPPPPTACW